MTQDTADRRKDVIDNGTYDVYIEIDCDCQELLDAVGLDYELSEDDDTQNEVKIILDKDEWVEFSADMDWTCTNEQHIGAYLLNYELSEYVTKVTVYKPSGDIISFY